MLGSTLNFLSTSGEYSTTGGIIIIFSDRNLFYVLYSFHTRILISCQEPKILKKYKFNYSRCKGKIKANLDGADILKEHWLYVYERDIPQREIITVTNSDGSREKIFCDPLFRDAVSLTLGPRREVEIYVQATLDEFLQSGRPTRSCKSAYRNDINKINKVVDTCVDAAEDRGVGEQEGIEEEDADVVEAGEDEEEEEEQEGEEEQKAVVEGEDDNDEDDEFYDSQQSPASQQEQA
jgi:hypothetical protein